MHVELDAGRPMNKKKNEEEARLEITYSPLSGGK